MPAEESMVACISSVGLSSYGSPARRSAASRSNQPGWRPVVGRAALRERGVGEVGRTEEATQVPSAVDVEVGALAPPLGEDRVEVVGHCRRSMYLAS